MGINKTNKDELKTSKTKYVSVGIPAYNEEANIGHLIHALLKQKGDNFMLKELIVISDGSNDRTAEIVRSISDERIIFRANKVRIGQALNQNKIIDLFTGDILVLLNADVLPADNYYIQKMVQPFYSNNNLGIVSSRVIPMTAETFFDRVINFSVQMKDDMIKKMRNGDNIYACHGRGRAFSRAFLQHFRWDEEVSEDAYSYLMCKKLGFDFSYVHGAAVLYRSPQSFKDHIRQSTRFFKGRKNLANRITSNMSKEIVAKEYKIPTRIILSTLIKYFFKNPFLFIIYIGILISAKILSLGGKSQDIRWEISKTSKTLFRKEVPDSSADMEIGKRIKIAILDIDNLKNPYLGGGGARVTKEIGKRLARSYDITVFCSKYPNSKDYTEDAIIYKHIGLGSKYPKLNILAFILTLPFVVRKIKADIILENFVAPFAICLSPLFTKIPVIFIPSFFNTQAMEKKYRLPFSKLMKVGLKLYKYGAPLTAKQAKIIARCNPKIITKVIPNGVDDSYFTHPTKEKNYFLFFGRIDVKNKGLDLLMKAFHSIQRNIIENLYVMGSGPESEIVALKKIIDTYKLNDRVKLLGRFMGSEKERYIAEAKYIVFPSLFESQSLSMLESLALGKAVICFDIDGNKWTGANICFKAASISAKALSEKMLEVSKDESLRKSTGRNARAFAKHYSWAKSTELYENMIRSVINN